MLTLSIAQTSYSYQFLEIAERSISEKMFLRYYLKVFYHFILEQCVLLIIELLRRLSAEAVTAYTRESFTRKAGSIRRTLRLVDILFGMIVLPMGQWRQRLLYRPASNPCR